MGGRRDGSSGFLVTLEPDVALKLGIDLMQAASLIERRALAATDELDEIVSTQRDGDHG